MKFVRQFLVAIAANGGAFMFGILLGWSAPTAEQIAQNHKYYFWVTNNEFAWIVGLMALGGALSCVLSGVLRSKIGTRYTIFLFGIPILIGWSMITIPISVAMLMIGRFLCGVSAGCYSYVLPIYVGEISSNEVRGSMLAMFQVGLNAGVLFVFTVGHFAPLLALNIICGSLSILYTAWFFLLPESPVLLISHEREHDAKRSLKRLRGKKFNVNNEIDYLKHQDEDLRAQQKTFKEVFSTKSTKKAFIIIMLQFVFFQMSGINVVLFYSTTIFTAAGIGLASGIASIIVASLQFATSLASLAVVDRFGRKIMLSISNSFMALSLIGIGTYFTLSDAGNDVGHLDWLPITSLSIFVVAFALGMGPVSYILLGELFMQDAKAFVAPIGQTVNLLLTFTIGLTFPMLTDLIGSGPTFFMFSGFCFLALIFTIFVIPETKGKSMEEIQNLLT